MIFPLGLGYIPRVFPWATLLLIIANVYFYKPNLQDQYVAHEKILVAKEKYKIYSILDSAYYAQCSMLYTYKECFMYGGSAVSLMLQELYYSDPERKPIDVDVRDENNQSVKFKVDFDNDKKKPPKYVGKWPISQFREVMDYTNYFKWFFDYAKYYIHEKNKYDNMDKISERISELDSNTEIYLKNELYKQNLQNYRDEVKKIHQELNLQSGYNVTSTSSFKSMFSHADLRHLVGNMVFLLFFGLFLEAKMGLLLFLSSYLIAGLIGGVVSSLIGSPLIFGVGASIAISGLMGLYYILFYKDKMLLKIYYIAIKKNAYIDNAVWFPLLYFATDILMSIKGESTGVNYVGHASGAVIGIFLAYIYEMYLGDVLPSGFHYNYQLEKWKEAVIDGSLKRLIVESKKLFEINPHNFSLRESFIRRAFPLMAQNSDPYYHAYFFQNYQKYLETEVDNGNTKKILEHTQKILKTGQLFDMMFCFEPNMILKLGDIMVKNKSFAEAIAYYELYVRSYPNAKITKSVNETINNIRKILDPPATEKIAA